MFVNKTSYNYICQISVNLDLFCKQSKNVAKKNVSDISIHGY